MVLQSVSRLRSKGVEKNHQSVLKCIKRQKMRLMKQEEGIIAINSVRLRERREPVCTKDSHPNQKPSSPCNDAVA